MNTLRLSTLVLLCLLVFILSTHLAFAATSGPNNPTVAANDASAGAGTISWSTITDAFVVDGASSASVSLGSGRTTKYLKFSGFNFAIPEGAIIDGITVAVARRTTAADVIADSVVGLVTTDATTTSKAGADFWPTTFEPVSYGGDADTWGRAWTPAEINGNSFGLILSAKNFEISSSRTVHIDGVTMTVSYHIPDTNAPVINPIADIEREAAGSTTVIDYGDITATDDVDGTHSVSAFAAGVCTPASGSAFSVGSTTVSCTATDSSGNIGTGTGLTIVVTDTTPPGITINGSATTTITVGDVFSDPGATALDSVDGSLLPIVTGVLDTNTAGTYTRTYTATDAHGNSSSAIRDVVVASAPPDAPQAAVQEIAPAAVASESPSVAPPPRRSGGGRRSSASAVVATPIVTATPAEGKVLGASVGPFTGAQASALVEFLRSFDVDQSIIDRVRAIAHL